MTLSVQEISPSEGAIGCESGSLLYSLNEYTFRFKQFSKTSFFLPYYSLVAGFLGEGKKCFSSLCLSVSEVCGNLAALIAGAVRSLRSREAACSFLLGLSENDSSNFVILNSSRSGNKANG
jgi:hypothetical protein